MLSEPLLRAAGAAADGLIARGDTVAVAESSAGGLIAAALLSVPGASRYFSGGYVIYTLDGTTAQLGGASELDRGKKGAAEPLARWLADSARNRLQATWAVGETGATGPDPNPYGDPPGHAWVAVAGPERIVAEHVLTGERDRLVNMELFAVRALTLLADAASPVG